MGPAIVVPLTAGVVLLGGAIAMRMKSLADKAKAAISAAPPVVPSPPSPPPAGAVVVPPPAAVEKQLPPITVNPDGSDRQPGTPFIFDSNADAAAAVAEANRLGISVHELLLRRTGALPTVQPAPSGVVGKRAVVTTNDPPPSGDLIIRTAPNDAAPQIAGGGADKGGTVTVIRDVDATWSEIDWPGGRRPGGRGFAKKRFLKLL